MSLGGGVVMSATKVGEGGGSETPASGDAHKA